MKKIKKTMKMIFKMSLNSMIVECQDYKLYMIKVKNNVKF
jgi:hypothetical protein